MTSQQTSQFVQFGCVARAPKSWMNFESARGFRLARLPIISRLFPQTAGRFSDNLLYGDIVKGLPVAPQSVARLFANHIFHDLSYQAALVAIRKSYALLKPGGIFRIVVPDLKRRAEKYIAECNQNSRLAGFEFLRSTVSDQNRRRGLWANLFAAAGPMGRRCMWDEPSLSAALREAGFTEIRRCSYGDSDDPLFAEVEDGTRLIEGNIDDLVIECKRPADLPGVE